jgi:hypothetical protein
METSRVRPIREIVLIISVVLGYRQIRFLTRNDTDQALANARRVVNFERDAHIFSEGGLQKLAMHSDSVVSFLNHYYVFVHFPLTAVFIIWVLARHPGSYRAIRTWIIAVTLAGLAIHVAYPLAPPRMLSQHGFVDTLRQYGPNIYSADTNDSVANQYAAMPSLHFGWAAIVAAGYIAIRRTRRSMLAIAHPVITLLAIVATANHYWIDAVIAFILVAIAAAFVLRTTLLRRSPGQRASRPGFALTDHLRPLAPRHSRRPGAVLLARTETSAQ